MDSATNDEGPADQVCQAYHRAIEIVGRRWSGAILFVLCRHAKRFCEIREAVPDISDRLLTERLKELEDEGIVERIVGTGRPVQVTYRLTPKGEELKPIIDAITQWAGRWQQAEEFRPGRPSSSE